MAMAAKVEEQDPRYFRAGARFMKGMVCAVLLPLKAAMGEKSGSAHDNCVGENGAAPVMVTYLDTDPKLTAIHNISKCLSDRCPNGCYCSHQNTRASSRETLATISRELAAKVGH